jgi:hypothetical protein
MVPKSNREDEPIRLTRHAPERRKKPTSVTLAGPGCCCTCCCLHTIGGLFGAVYGSVVPIKDMDRWKTNFPTLSAKFRPTTAATPEAAEGRFAAGIETMARPVDSSFTAQAPGGIVAGGPKTKSQPVAPSFAMQPDEIHRENVTFRGAALYWSILAALVMAAMPLWHWYQSINAPGFERTNLAGSIVLVLFCLPVIQLAASLLSAFIVAVFYREKQAALARIGQITFWSVGGSFAGAGLVVLLCCVFSGFGRM